MEKDMSRNYKLVGPELHLVVHIDQYFYNFPQAVDMNMCISVLICYT